MHGVGHLQYQHGFGDAQQPILEVLVLDYPGSHGLAVPDLVSGDATRSGNVG